MRKQFTRPFATPGTVEDTDEPLDKYRALTTSTDTQTPPKEPPQESGYIKLPPDASIGDISCMACRFSKDGGTICSYGAWGEKPPFAIRPQNCCDFFDSDKVLKGTERSARTDAAEGILKDMGLSTGTPGANAPLYAPKSKKLRSVNPKPL